jgi:hypothetical protein
MCVFVCVFSIQGLKELIDFYENLQERYSIGGHLNQVIPNFLQAMR